MKKIISSLLIFICCLLIVGCNKIETIEQPQEFIDIYYEYYAGYESDFVGIDLRDYDTQYTEGHFKGFVSFDYFPGMVEGNVNEQGYVDRFSSWVKLNYNKKITIFLVDSGNGIVEKVMKILEDNDFESVYGFKGGYDSLINVNNNVIDIITGGEGCNC